MHIEFRQIGQIKFMKRQHEHITPILCTLYWHSVNFRINFIFLLFLARHLLIFLSFYVCVLCLEHFGQLLLSVARSKLKSGGDRAFSVVAPKLHSLWNILQFYRQAHLFSVPFSPSLASFTGSCFYYLFLVLCLIAYLLHILVFYLVFYAFICC